MGTVVLVTRTRWHEAPRIRHQVARHLSRFHRVIFVETPLTWRGRYDTEVAEVERGIYRCTLSNRATLPVKIQHYVPFVHGFVEKFLVRELERVLAGGWQKPLILFNFDYDAVAVMRSALFALKVYFCNDDFPAAVSNALSRFIVGARERKVAASADLCLAVHNGLVDKLIRFNENSRLFLPGHDFRLSLHLRNGPGDLEKIRVAFMGYIDSRLEYRWLARLLRQGDMELHLIGPVEKSGETEAFMALEGLRYHDSKYGDELQEFLKTMDVLVIPYKTSMKNVQAVTASNKLFSYIAAGKPVVISDMPRYLELGEGIIYRANTGHSFAEQIRRAYREDSMQFREARRRIAEEYSWEKRGLELREIINGCLRDKNIAE